MKTAFLISGILLCVVGGGVMFYQLSESCEASGIPSTTHMYPWCSDVLDHINLTFAGVLALFAGIVVLALGGSMHWILERNKGTEASE